MIISPLILSHVLAHVALRRDLNLVFEELFTAGGAEIYLRTAEDYGLTSKEMSFRGIQKAVSQFGDIGLGVQVLSEGEGGAGRIILNPDTDSRWRLKSRDKMVVLTTYS